MANNNLLIPPYGTKGLYVLLPPFDAVLMPAELYECGAVRSFEDIENNGKKVYDLYYKPFNIDENTALQDRQKGHVIVTLLSPKYPPVYVPSSYIKSYPDLSSKPYNNVIFTGSLGPLPDDIVLDVALEAAANAISDFLGVLPVMHVGIMPLSDAITPEQHESREAARLGALGRIDTDYSRVKTLQDQNALLKQRNAILEQIVKDNGLLG